MAIDDCCSGIRIRLKADNPSYHALKNSIKYKLGNESESDVIRDKDSKKLYGIQTNDVYKKIIEKATDNVLDKLNPNLREGILELQKFMRYNATDKGLGYNSDKIIPMKPSYQLERTLKLGGVDEGIRRVMNGNDFVNNYKVA